VKPRAGVEGEERESGNEGVEETWSCTLRRSSGCIHSTDTHPAPIPHTAWSFIRPTNEIGYAHKNPVSIKRLNLVEGNHSVYVSCMGLTIAGVPNRLSGLLPREFSGIKSKKKTRSSCEAPSLSRPPSWLSVVRAIRAKNRKSRWVSCSG
jgi:hypothetical protein